VSSPQGGERRDGLNEKEKAAQQKRLKKQTLHRVGSLEGKKSASVSQKDDTRPAKGITHRAILKETSSAKDNREDKSNLQPGRAGITTLNVRRTHTQ